MNPLAIFFLGSFAGGSAVAVFAAIINSRKFQEAHDEFLSMREAIRRNAYSSGYEDAKTGKLKRS